MPPRKQTCSTGPDPANVTVCVRRTAKKIPTVGNAYDMCKVVRKAGGADRESFYAIALDSRLNVLGVEEVARGQVDGVSVHPRETFKSAILQGASSVAFAHNHPSGDPTPSREDIALTKRLIDGGVLLGIPVTDHVVVGRYDCHSIRGDAQHSALFGGDTLKKSGYPMPTPGEGASVIRDTKRRK
jgi:DNA repair protein RadC